MSVHDVDATQLIHGVAEELKKDATIKAPAWAPFVKTGMSRERAPVQSDWWHVRAASILRRIFMLGPIGTSKLKNHYGGRKNEGMAPEHFHPGSGNHIRKILQQLEKAGLAKQTAKGVHKGRIVTPKGHKLLESIASNIMKEQGIVIASKPKEAPKEIPKVEEKAEAPVEKVKKPRAPRKKKEVAEVPAAQ